MERIVVVHFHMEFCVYKGAPDLEEGNAILVLVLPLTGCVALNTLPHPL